MTTQPLTARKHANPIRVRLARAGLPLTLAQTSVEGAFWSALRVPVVVREKIAA